VVSWPGCSGWVSAGEKFHGKIAVKQDREFLTRGKRMVHFSLMTDSVRKTYGDMRNVYREKFLGKSTDKPKEQK